MIIKYNIYMSIYVHTYHCNSVTQNEITISDFSRRTEMLVVHIKADLISIQSIVL